MKRKRYKTKEEAWKHLLEDIYISPTGCWLVLNRGLDTHGYIRIGYGGGKVISGHRLSYEMTYGKSPDPMALHTCDIRNCINPGHLFEGTALDNVQDMIAKGRSSSLASANPRKRKKGEKISNDKQEKVLLLLQEAVKTMLKM